MIPLSILLPPLSAKDRAEFNTLCADSTAARALVMSCNNDARIARKKELQAKLKAAPRAQLLSIGAELETLHASYEHARRSAKMQLKELGPRYVAFFPRLLDRCQSHANELIARAKAEWAKHFIAFGAEPAGESPLVAHLAQWKRALAEKRAYIDLIASTGVTPNPPASVLPYSTSNQPAK